MADEWQNIGGDSDLNSYTDSFDNYDSISQPEWAQNYNFSGSGGDGYNWNTLNVNQGQPEWDNSYIPQASGNWGNSLSSIGNGSTYQGGTQEFSSGVQDYLKNIFTNPQFLTKGIGALFEGIQNKRSSNNLNRIAGNLQRAGDPFASQRGQYQRLLSDTYTNPNIALGRPEIRAQLQGLENQMNARDAAAGRRSQYGDRANQLAIASSGLLDRYRQQLAQLAGGGLSPNFSGLSNLYQEANRQGTNGFLSPIMSAVGMGTQQQRQQDFINQLSSLFERNR